MVGVVAAYVRPGTQGSYLRRESAESITFQNYDDFMLGAMHAHKHKNAYIITHKNYVNAHNNYDKVFYFQFSHQCINFRLGQGVLAGSSYFLTPSSREISIQIQPLISKWNRNETSTRVHWYSRFIITKLHAQNYYRRPIKSIRTFRFSRCWDSKPIIIF